MRLNFGIAAAAAGAAFVVLAVVAGLPQWTRLLAFLPFLGGTFGFFQYQEKT